MAYDTAKEDRLVVSFAALMKIIQQEWTKPRNKSSDVLPRTQFKIVKNLSRYTIYGKIALKRLQMQQRYCIRAIQDTVSS